MPASARWMRLPTSVEPVKATLSTPGWPTSAAPVGPALRDDVDHARRQVALLEALREQQRGERRGLGGLEHHGVAAGEGGGELPRGHEQREVPGDHLARHAERARAPAGQGVVELVGPARVVEEVRRGERDVDVARLLDRLAAVERLDDGELARALLDAAGDAVDVLAALLARHLRPHLLVGAARRRDGAVDVGLVRVGDLGDHRLGRGVDGGEVLAARGRGELPVDEQLVARREPHVVGRLGRRRVEPALLRRLGHASLHVRVLAHSGQSLEK